MAKCSRYAPFGSIKAPTDGRIGYSGIGWIEEKIETSGNIAIDEADETCARFDGRIGWMDEKMW